MMQENQDMIKQKFGKTIYKRGTATSYEGPVDEDENGFQRRRRREKRGGNPNRQGH